MTTMNQAQNEALVKLMLAARYQDKKLSLAEEETFKKLLNELKWESLKDIGVFVQRETAAVRRAVESEATLQSFITTQCALLKDETASAATVKMLEAVIKADSENAQENEFMKKVVTALQA